MSPTAASIVDAIGWSLVYFVWQGALVAGVLAAALSLLTNAKPLTRYLLAYGALLACVALPIASFSETMSVPSRPDLHGLSGPHLRVAARSMADVEPVVQWVGSNMSMLVLAWLCCVALLTVRMGVGLVWVARMRAQASAEADHVWKRSFVSLTGMFGLRRPVALRVVRGLATPMTAGWWRPIVFVPAALIAGMPADLLEALLAHELAHIKRHDYVINLLQTVIEVLLFFHPAVWWISRQIRLEREEMADDLAAQTLGEPRRLALALQSLELLRSSGPRLAQAAAGGSLVGRIRRLVSPGQRSIEWKSAIAVAAVLVVSAAIYARAAQPVFTGGQAAIEAPDKIDARLKLALTFYKNDQVVARPTVIFRPGQSATVTADDFTVDIVATGMSDTSVDLTMDVRAPSDRPLGHAHLKAKIEQDISASYRDDAGNHYRITAKPSLASPSTPREVARAGLGGASKPPDR